MTIVAKEVKTIIKAEISEEEFADQYQAMMQDVANKRYITDKFNKETAEAFLNLSEEAQMNCIDKAKCIMGTTYGDETFIGDQRVFFIEIWG